MRIQYLETDRDYLLFAKDEGLVIECELSKNPSDTTDLDDWVSNYKAAANEPAIPKDQDGSIIVKTKTTRVGWHYEPRSIDWYTSTAGSLYNRKHNGNTIDTGTDYGDAVIRFYNAAGTDITAQEQSVLDTDCVKTVVDWQPTFEMDIIGCTVSCVSAPVAPQRAYAWVIVAPDIPEQFGGSVPFMAGGWNLRFLRQDSTTFIDGRGVKTFQYDPVNNSNKIRVIVKHDAGLKIGLQFVAEIFKA